VVGERVFLFDGDVDILCGIKDFSALLALNEFNIVLAGDDFDDGMFADGSHWLGSMNGMDFARPREACQQRSEVFLWCEIDGEVVVEWWSKVVASTSFWTYTI
jgi:hypothetical protein